MMRNTREMSFVKYRCAICNLITVSLNELHYHQTCWHSSEELSLSVINLQGFINYNNSFSEQKVNPTVWNNPTVEPQIYVQPTDLLSDVDNNNTVIQNQTNYVSVAKNTDIESTLHLEHLKAEWEQSYVISTKAGPSGIQKPQLGSLPFENVTCASEDNKMHLANISENSLFDVSLEMELNKKIEINEEAFLNSVNGLCTDLNKIKNKPIKGKNLQKKMSSQAKRLLKLQQEKQTIHKDSRKNLKKINTKHLYPVKQISPMTQLSSATDKFSFPIEDPIKVLNEETNNNPVAEAVYPIERTNENIVMLNSTSEDYAWSPHVLGQTQEHLEKTRREMRPSQKNYPVFQDVSLNQKGSIHKSSSLASAIFPWKHSDINEIYVTPLNHTNEIRLNNIENTTYSKILLNNDEETFYQNSNW